MRKNESYVKIRMIIQGEVAQMVEWTLVKFFFKQSWVQILIRTPFNMSLLPTTRPVSAGFKTAVIDTPQYKFWGNILAVMHL